MAAATGFRKREEFHSGVQGMDEGRCPWSSGKRSRTEPPRGEACGAVCTTSRPPNCSPTALIKSHSSSPDRRGVRVAFLKAGSQESQFDPDLPDAGLDSTPKSLPLNCLRHRPALSVGKQFLAEPNVQAT